MLHTFVCPLQELCDSEDSDPEASESSDSTIADGDQNDEVTFPGPGRAPDAVATPISNSCYPCMLLPVASCYPFHVATLCSLLGCFMLMNDGALPSGE